MGLLSYAQATYRVKTISAVSASTAGRVELFRLLAQSVRATRLVQYVHAKAIR